VANLENGRRPGITVHEVAVLARALDVAPLELLFPVGHEAVVPVLPEEDTEPMVAALWFIGQAPWGERAAATRRNDLALFTQFEDRRRALVTNLAAADHVQGRSDTARYRAAVREAHEAMVLLREVMESRGLTAPDLPDLPDWPVEGEA
jgi:hypothetical protein